jgi:hypothetical protein
MAGNTGPTRDDGRKQMLVYLRPAVITAIKTEALAQDKHAYELVETALEQYLAKQAERSAT